MKSRLNDEHGNALPPHPLTQDAMGTVQCRFYVESTNIVRELPTHRGRKKPIERNFTCICDENPLVSSSDSGLFD
ncbi:hypothetical protein FF011L_47820 [Roseimaritima multifibrata]|uniref:Uncharacterized protein n=1 Tax=Roseimaritima multifibrata TaxID=1930274 RepID=A0A517MM62_9BACT|nr:hypothetical protein FF011L_47820 [Roseimaritima multifibrata]